MRQRHRPALIARLLVRIPLDGADSHAVDKAQDALTALMLSAEAGVEITVRDTQFGRMPVVEKSQAVATPDILATLAATVLDIAERANGPQRPDSEIPDSLRRVPRYPTS
jgi:hypothetical protein